MKTPPGISIIIPAFNAEATVARALEAVSFTGYPGLEVIVVDDASTDGTAAVCGQFPVRLVRLARNAGPAHARNVGARVANGELLLFLDADTCLEAGGLARIAAAFEGDPELDGLIGAYDDEPAAPGMLSQYRNLLHCFVHRMGRRRASTFWSGCGAMRSSVFLAHGGFDETYLRPSIEDLELGYRLARAGRKVLMDPSLQVKHLKRWTLGSMIRTDIMDRGVPWTELIFRERFMPVDLSLGLTQRVSVAGILGVLGLCVAAMVSAARGGGHQSWLELGVAVAIWLGVLVLNALFYSFLYVRRGLLFTLKAVALHQLFYFYNGVAFVLGTAAWSYRSHPIKTLKRRLFGFVAG